MNQDQRADFEAWYMREFEVYPRRSESGGFKSQYVNAMFKSWKAGYRAALQSQDKVEPSEWLRQHEALMHRVSKAALVVGYGGTINGTTAEQALENAEKALLDHALALQSQPEIDEAHLSIILDVYDNAMQKAFDGREFQNPCKPETPEHKAWGKGSKEGKKKRDAGLPHSIALQSQDREDAQEIASTLATVLHFIPKEDEPELYADIERLCGEFIDHARRAEGES